MHALRFLTATVLAVAVPSFAIAQPHRIAQLGSAPLIGEIASTSQLKSDVTRDRAVFKAAGWDLGLSPEEYAQFASRIAAGHLSYVTLPRHLDAMTWGTAGRVYVQRDVVIPPATKGWEIDLEEPDETVALFIPARCGNLSIVRRLRPRIAKAPAPKRIDPLVAPLHFTAALPVPTPPPIAFGDGAPKVVIAALTPQATPTPAIFAVAQPAQTHHSGWWPLLLIPMAFLFHGHGAVSQISSAPLPVVTPVPLVGCTPAPH